MELNSERRKGLWKELESFRMWFPAVILSHRRKKEHYKFKANLIYIANQKPELDFWTLSGKKKLKLLKQSD